MRVYLSVNKKQTVSQTHQHRTTVKTTEYDGFEYIVMCSGCDCPNGLECPSHYGIECDTQCDYTIVITTKARAGVIFVFVLLFVFSAICAGFDCFGYFVFTVLVLKVFV